MARQAAKQRETTSDGKATVDDNSSKQAASNTKKSTPIVSVALTLAVAVVAVVIGFDVNGSYSVARKLLSPVPKVNEVCFTLHFNGDGTGEGIPSCVHEWTDGIDEMMFKVCPKLDVKENLCAPNSGVRMYNGRGKRIWSFEDVRKQDRLYIVPQGKHFVWPSHYVGHKIYPESVQSPVPGKPLVLTQLSLSPLVFSVDNFMTSQEMESLIQHNIDNVKRSEVGFSGQTDNTRTSSTSWDGKSPAARSIQRRSFEVLSMDYDLPLADTTQVLRYETDEWYKPHVDWFDERGFDGHDPTVNNGTNRFATVFLYLTTVEEGGHTVFPLSTTHEGYNGERIVHENTVKTPGYIANKDARWACNTTSTALRSNPVAGNAVIFYSQMPDGTLDPYSLHGGCPVKKGTKWAANVWLWNRPKPSKSKAKDRKTGKDAQVHPDAISVTFDNQLPFNVQLFWDSGTELVMQLDIPAGGQADMNSYISHSFKAKDANGKIVWSSGPLKRSQHNGDIVIS